MDSNSLKKGKLIMDSLEDEVLISKISSVPMLNVDWLWPDRIPVGKITVLAGNPGLGKSQITAYIAAVLTGLIDWPDCNSRKRKTNVIFLSAEDDPSDTMKPRLVAAGADPEYCHVIKAIKEETEAARPFQLSTDINRLSRAIDNIGNVSLVIIDPISAYMGDKDSNNNSAVRSLLMPLSDLAAQKNVAILLVTHLNKSQDQDILGRVIGSIGLIAAARVGYAVVKDKENPDIRYFLPIKSNIGNDKDGFSFQIEEAHILDDFITTSKVVWNPQKIEAQKIFFPENNDKQSQTNGAKRFLKSLLEHGPKPASEIFDESQGAGYSKSVIRRAADSLGVIRKKSGMNGGWIWSLRETDASDFLQKQSRMLGEKIEDSEDDFIL